MLVFLYQSFTALKTVNNVYPAKNILTVDSSVQDDIELKNNPEFLCL